MLKLPRVLCFLLGVFLFSSCTPQPQEDAAITIDNVKISAESFDALYKMFYPQTMPEDSVSRKEFLETVISKKLMLLEAERLGLHRDPQFLREVELFWQERLLTLILKRKNEEYQSVQVSDAEIQAYYESHRDFFGAASLEEKKDVITKLLIQNKQMDLMNNWLKSLRGNADVQIDYSKLGIKP